MDRTEIRIYEDYQKREPLTVMYRNPVRKIDGALYGLKVGAADYIGWKPVLITADMVGKIIGQFVSWEIKTATDSLDVDQAKWFLNAQRDGCDAKVIQEIFGVLTELDTTTILKVLETGGRKGR